MVRRAVDKKVKPVERKPIVNITQQNTNKYNQKLYVVKVRNKTIKDTKLFQEITDKKVIEKIKMRLKEFKALKISLRMKVIMFSKIYDKYETIEINPKLSADNVIMNEDEIQTHLKKIYENIDKEIEHYKSSTSDMVVHEIVGVELFIYKYVPPKGRSYLELPKNCPKRSVINVKNDDNMCFKWAVLSALHYKDVNQKSASKVCVYKKYEKELNFDGIEFPVSGLSSYKRFEKLNEQPINVFLYEKGKVRPFYISRYISESNKEIINLLLYSNESREEEEEEVYHYVWIKNFSGMFPDGQKRHLFYCYNCLSHFTKQELLDKHKQLGCYNYEAASIKLPAKENAFIKYTEIQKQLKVPFVLYCDIEAILEKLEVDFREEDEDESVVSKTINYQKHKPYYIGCKFVSYDKDIDVPEYKVFEGDDCIDKFFEFLDNNEEYFIEYLKKNEPMIKLTNEEEKRYETQENCDVCSKKLKGDRVRDHDHITGKFRSVLHSNCNIRLNNGEKKSLLQESKFIPVIFHNLKGYDSHHIMTKLGKYSKDKRISCIASNSNKYISFSYSHYRFLDSCQFLNSSLEELVESAKKGDCDFSYFEKAFECYSNETRELLKQKGVFPYDWFDCEDKLDKKSLPSIEAFYSKLDNDELSEKDYDRANDIYNKTNCKSFRDYVKLYLKTDIYLLIDVFENFRNVCIKYYGLDPCHFYTSPSLSWSACLKLYEKPIEIFNNEQMDMLLTIEKGMRGGISTIIHRYANVKNGNGKIMYFDANNLYGYAMSKKLPIGDYKWEDVENFNTNRKILNIDVDGERGYIFDVDIEYPKELHNKHNDYPFLPESIYTSENSSVKKLCPNLNNKTNYVCHVRNLQQALSHGLILKKVHRVMSFEQGYWMKDFISFNTEKRKEAKSSFEKDFFKLMNNSVFGKTCENLRKRIDFKLVSNEKRADRLISRPHFKHSNLFFTDDNYLVGIEMGKLEIEYDRPIIAGFCVLEISKTLMYQFHYDVMKPTFGDDLQLLFTDTDSLCYHIKSDNVKEKLYNSELRDWFDLSEYDKSSKYYDEKNCKVIGKFKDESAKDEIVEFVGLRAKLYSYITKSDKEAKRCKGVKKSYVKKILTHKTYKKILYGEKDENEEVQFNVIRSKNHELYSMKISKIGLSNKDDKRIIKKDKISTYAIGHKDTRL